MKNDEFHTKDDDFCKFLHVSRNRMDVLAEVTPEAFLNQELDFGILGRITNCRVLSVTAVSDYKKTGFVSKNDEFCI